MHTLFHVDTYISIYSPTNPAEGYGIKYEGSFLEKSQSGCVQNFCHFVCLHHFWA